MIVRDASDDDVRAVIAALHPEDAEEQFAIRWDASPEALAAELVAARPIAIKHFCLAADDGAAVATVGAFLVMPKVAALHQARTARWPEIARAATDFYRRRFVPFVLAPNVRMAECRVLESHRRALRWLAMLGFRIVGEALPYGSRGERFVHTAWVNPQPPE